MRFVQSLHHRILRDTQGSAVVGFVLVAPLIVLAFLAVFHLAMLGSAYIGLTTAVAEGSREAAVLGESDNQAKHRIIELARHHSLQLSPEQVTIRHVTQNEIAVVQVSVYANQTLSFLDRVVTLHSKAEVIDEDAYR